MASDSSRRLSRVLQGHSKSWEIHSCRGRTRTQPEFAEDGLVWI